MDNQDIRKAGLKVTLPRLKILEILERAKPQHISAESVYKKLLESGDDVGLATVYRVLTQFQAAGLVKRHNFENDYAVFEIEDGKHHDHLVCVRCGRVDEFLDEMIEKRQEVIAKQSSFKMTDHNLTIYGFCQGCDSDEISSLA